MADEDISKLKQAFTGMINDLRKSGAEKIAAEEAHGIKMRKAEEDARLAGYKADSLRIGDRKVVKSESGNYSYAGADGKGTTDMVAKGDTGSIEGEREADDRWNKLISISDGILDLTKKNNDIFTKMLDSVKEKAGFGLALLAAPISIYGYC